MRHHRLVKKKKKKIRGKRFGNLRKICALKEIYMRAWLWEKKKLSDNEEAQIPCMNTWLTVTRTRRMLIIDRKSGARRGEHGNTVPASHDPIVPS